MKIKKRKSVLFATLLALVLVVSTAFSGCMGKNKISLDSLKTDGEYQYSKAMWHKSAEEVKKTLPYSVSAKEGMQPLSGICTIYYSEPELEIGGQKARADFEFYDDKLLSVSFDVHLTSEIRDEWVEEQLGKLREQYGNETETSEKEGLPVDLEAYAWKTDNTVLTFQIYKLQGKGPSATIAVYHNDIKNYSSSDGNTQEA